MNDIRWADQLLVMEHKHRMVETFSHWVTHKLIHVLDIPDNYAFMDDELVKLVKESIADV